MIDYSEISLEEHQRKKNIDSIVKHFTTSVRGYLNMIFREGETYGDRFAIAWYFSKIPLHLIYRKLNIPYSSKFYRDITLKTEVKMFCGNNISYARIVNSTFEEEIMEEININSGTFIDVGSHIGKYGIQIAKRLNNKGMVLAVEPDKSNFRMLKHNAKINNLNNIILENVGCFKKNCERDFFVMNNPDRYSGNNTLYEDKFEHESHRVKIKCVTIDSLVKKHSLKNINLIKIDVEGAEIDVLMGARKTLKTHRPQIIMEVIGKDLVDQFYKIMKSLDYEFKEIENGGYWLAKYRKPVDKQKIIKKRERVYKE